MKNYYNKFLLSDKKLIKKRTKTKKMLLHLFNPKKNKYLNRWLVNVEITLDLYLKFFNAENMEMITNNLFYRKILYLVYYILLPIKFIKKSA